MKFDPHASDDEGGGVVAGAGGYPQNLYNFFTPQISISLRTSLWWDPTIANALEELRQAGASARTPGSAGSRGEHSPYKRSFLARSKWSPLPVLLREPRRETGNQLTRHKRLKVRPRRPVLTLTV